MSYSISTLSYFQVYTCCRLTEWPQAFHTEVAGKAGDEVLLVHICAQLVAAATGGIKRLNERMCGGEQEVSGTDMLSLRYLSATQVEVKNSQLDIRI